MITDTSYYKHIILQQVQANSIRNGAPIFHSQIVKIGAKSEHFCHLPRYRSTAPIFGAAKDSAQIFSIFYFDASPKQVRV